MMEGNPLLLVCEPDGFPVPVIIWTKNGKLLMGSENKTEFIIHDTSKEDAGKYKCEASNIAGRASYTCTVEVTGKGEFYLVFLPHSFAYSLAHSFIYSLHSLSHSSYSLII